MATAIDTIRLGTTKLTLNFNLQTSIQTATSTNILVQKPSGASATWAATINDAVTGTLYHNACATDFNQVGIYTFVPVVNYNEGQVLSQNISKLEVIPKFAITNTAGQIPTVRKGTTKLQFKYSTGIDLSSATSASVEILKPDKTVVVKSATIVSPANLGIVTYDTVASDIANSGTYVIILRLDYASGIVYAKEETRLIVKDTFTA